MVSPTLLVFLYAVRATVAQPDFLYLFCAYDKGNYTANSTYEENLNHFLLSLSSNSYIDNGFYNSSYGQKYSQVHAMGLCRGDVDRGICSDCLRNAASLLRQRCPDQKEAIGWYDECMLRYSNRSIFGIMETSPGFPKGGVNSVSVNYTDTFHDVVRTSLETLRSQAAAGGSALKFAAKNATLPNFKALSTLVQCTPDLSEKDCNDCLLEASEGLPRSDGNALGRIVRPSCAIRFEVHPLIPFNESTPQSSTPSPYTVVLKVSSTDPAASAEEKYNRNKSLVLVIILFVPVSFLVLLAAMGIYVKMTSSTNKLQMNEARGRPQFLGFDFGTIKDATQNFSEACKLGEDEFGIVYKGTLPGGALIAVKRLVRDHEPRNTEVENEDIPRLVTKLQHPNVVRILGFCYEGRQKLLTYEFVPNTSLDHFLSAEPIQRANFNWEMRYKIIKGIAEGILYLQNNFQVCSHDLKASTILLDEEMNPKISAFGLGSLFALYPIEETERTVAGTNGYLVPQNEMLRSFSKKSNVYKFGILVLEIVSGQRNSSFQNGENGEDLLSYVWRNWTEMATSNVVDPRLVSVSTTQQDTIMRCIQIGLLCVQKNVAGLPTMDSVNDMLNRRSSGNLPLPSQPATLLPDSSTESEMSSRGGHNTEATESTLSKRQPKRRPSQKEETLSNLQPKRAPSLRSTLVRALGKLKGGRLWKCNTIVARDAAS